MIVQSILGEGTTFELYLSAHIEKSIATSEPFDVRSDGDEKSMLPELGRVLIIDDEPIIRRLVTDGLTQYGYEVMSAEDGEEALIL